MSLRSSAANGGANVKHKVTSSSASTPQASQEKQKMLLASDTGHFSIIRALHLADLITELNGFCGFMSILSSLRYASGPADDYTNIYVALAFIPFGLFFDFMDGKVARWRRKSSLMGQELDSLADLISFGVAPATAAFALGLRTPLDTLLLAFFVLCGLTRLARFNVTASSLPKDATGKSKYFEGFPIPTSLGIVSCMATCVYLGRIEGGEDGIIGGSVGRDTLGGLLEVHPIVGVFVGWGCAMVSKSIHIPKP
ncbi:MAG: hypothetical protein Q9163_005221 [Psora crenata]